MLAGRATGDGLQQYSAAAVMFLSAAVMTLCWIRSALWLYC